MCILGSQMIYNPYSEVHWRGRQPQTHQLAARCPTRWNLASRKESKQPAFEQRDATHITVAIWLRNATDTSCTRVLIQTESPRDSTCDRDIRGLLFESTYLILVPPAHTVCVSEFICVSCAWLHLAGTERILKLPQQHFACNVRFVGLFCWFN